mgnify:FL=1
MAAKSKLPAATNARRNTKTGRAAMGASSFAIPETKSYRIDDAPHARSALARVAANGTPAQQAKVKKAGRAKYPGIAVDGKTPTKKGTPRKG